MSWDWLTLALGLAVVIYVAWPERKDDWCAGCGVTIHRDPENNGWRTRYPLFIWNWKDFFNPYICDPETKAPHRPMMKKYCRVCNERLVEGVDGWYALAKITNPEYGNPLECENWNGHEPR